MKHIRVLTSLSVALVLGISGASWGQDNSGMTAEELAALFAKQKTRGLVIAPNTGTAGDVAAGTDTAVTSEAAATYVELAPSDQVNVQISFDFDSAALREDQKPKLVNLCTAMKAVDVQLFKIVGHTDSSGSASYNESLSRLRAEEVKRYLVSDCGIPESRMEAVGVGEAFPFDKADPKSSANRRVEFQVVS